jgi:hypothetical protein
LGWDYVVRKELREIKTSWEGIKREALNTIGWRRIVHNCVGLRRLGAAVNC